MATAEAAGPERTHYGNETGEGLSPEMVASFFRDGFLVLRDELSPRTVEELLSETDRLLKEFEFSGEDKHPKTKFVTGKDCHNPRYQYSMGDYFLKSATNISYFLEDGLSEEQEATISPRDRVNKIAHGVHTGAEKFGKVTMNARNKAILRSLFMEKPEILQSMILLKLGNGVGTAVPPHADSSFLYTDPPSAIGFWYALESADPQNGGLQFAPGSHRSIGIKRRFVRLDPDDPDAGLGFVPNTDGAEFPKPGHGYLPEASQGYDSHHLSTTEPVKLDPALDTPAGTLVLIHGNVLHGSARNFSQSGRAAYGFHAIDREGTNYDRRNWLQWEPERL